MDRLTIWLTSEPNPPTIGVGASMTSVLQVADIEHLSEFKEYLHEVQVLASIEAPQVAGIEHLSDFKQVLASIEALDWGV